MVIGTSMANTLIEINLAHLNSDQWRQHVKGPTFKPLNRQGKMLGAIQRVQTSVNGTLLVVLDVTNCAAIFRSQPQQQ